MKRYAVFVLLVALLCSPAVSLAKGGGGGRSSGGSRSSPSRSAPKPSTPKPSTPKPSTPKPSTPKPAPKPNLSKPSTATQVKTSATAKTVNGKTYSKKGYVVDEKYKPTFRGGYVAPAGSTVYYQSSMWDWFPIYYLMTHDSHRSAVVQQPDGKEEVVKEEGTDSMYVINWIIVILLGLGLIALVVYLINKRTLRNKYV